jgi:predicted regulator of Ras-like GTPase activity (Roadblock/LC7/MglB family)
MQGDLKDMAVAELIQHACQDGKTACLVVEHRGQRAEVYFERGRVVHARMGSEEGEQVIFDIFPWSEGRFSLEPCDPSTRRTIMRSYQALLLEGARRVDEGAPAAAIPDVPEVPSAPGAGSQEGTMTEIIHQLSEIEGVDGAVLVAEDGVVLQQNVAGDAEKEGAVAAFVGAAAVQAGESMSLGPLKNAAVTSSGGTMLVLRHRDYYVGLLMEEGASPSLVTSRAQAYLQGVK